MLLGMRKTGDNWPESPEGTEGKRIEVAKKAWGKRFTISPAFLLALFFGGLGDDLLARSMPTKVEAQTLKSLPP